MISRSWSLKGKDRFWRVEKEGKIIQSNSFGLSFFNREDKEKSLFGFVISKKISKDSFQRNRVRRAISEAVRYLLTETRPGFDVVFLAKQESLRASTDQIMREVRITVEKAGLLR